MDTLKCKQKGLWVGVPAPPGAAPNPSQTWCKPNCGRRRSHTWLHRVWRGVLTPIRTKWGCGGREGGEGGGGGIGGWGLYVLFVLYIFLKYPCTVLTNVACSN